MDFIVGLPRTQKGYYYLGNRRSVDQGGTFHSCQDYLYGCEVSRAIHGKDCMFGWGTKEDCF
jgi:hypothetical protein